MKAVGWFVVVLALVATSCARADTPTVPANADAQLVEGRQIYINQCATCHGGAGNGGRGKKLADGALLERYPDIADNIDHVADGVGIMPAYSGRLTEDQILGVVRYTREVLAVAE